MVFVEDPPDDELDLRVEFEIGGTWTDVSDRLEQPLVPISRGRKNESSLVAPSATSLTLTNDDGELTPQNPESAWWPHITRGLPCRVSVQADEAWVALGAGSVSTSDFVPDVAGTDTEFWVAAEFVASPTTVTGIVPIISQWEPSGDERSWLLGWWPEHNAMVWVTSPDGTDSGHSVEVGVWPNTVQPGRTVRFGVRHSLHDIGTIGPEVARLYRADTWGSWSPLGQEVGGVDFSLRGPFDSTAAVVIGGVDASTDVLSVQYAGDPAPDGTVGISDETVERVWRAEVRNGGTEGHDGTLLGSPDFTGEAEGSTSVVDGQANTWTVNSPAEITDREFRIWGEVAAINPAWPRGDIEDAAADYPGYALTTFEVAGPLRSLRQSDEVAESPLLVQLRDNTNLFDPPIVLGYWPFEEGFGAAPAIPGPADPLPFPPAAVTSPRWAYTEPSTAGSGPLATFPGRTVLTLYTPQSGASARLAIECLAYLPSNASTTFEIHTPKDSTVWLFGVTITGDDYRTFYTTSTGTTTIATETVGDDELDRWVWLRFEVDQTATPTVSLQLRDGESFDVVRSFSDSTVSATVIGGLGRIRCGNGAGIGHVMVTAGFPSNGAGYDDAFAGHAGETAVDRVLRIAEQESAPTVVWPSSMSTPLGPQTRQPVVSLFDDAAQADFGVLAERRDSSSLEFRAGHTLLNQTPKLVLDARTDGVVIPGSLSPTLDDLDYATKATVSRPGGSSASAGAGTPSVSETHNVNTDLQLTSQAGWLLHLSSWEEMRVGNIELDLAVAPHLIDDYLSLRIGDVVRVTGLPSQFPTDTLDLIWQGDTETLGRLAWTVKGTATAAGPWTVGTLDGDEAGTIDDYDARLDTMACELENGINDTTTSVDVRTTVGPNWVDSTSHPDEFPFDVVIGGERMTVTAVGGGPEVQTFTVVRSVNNVTKSHSAGAAVVVAEPIILTF